MYRARKEDLSLYFYLKDVALKDYIELQEKDELSLSNEVTFSNNKIYNIISSSSPSPFQFGRGITYFDDLTNECLVNTTTISGTPEQSDRVIVYDKNLNILEDDTYIVDYISGRIILLQSVQPKYIDYYYHYVGLVDDWAYLPASQPPMVVLDMSATSKGGYQLGGGKKTSRKCSLHIFASSSSERSDLTELLYDSLFLKNCPIYDFERGSALDYDGTFFNRKNNLDKTTNLFSRATVSGVSNLRFEDVESRNINLSMVSSTRNESAVLSDLNKYRSRINFNLESYS